jgi:ABC-2 type transport system ATP-binding protein
MIISASKLSKYYGNRKVLDNFDISCSASEICGLIGVNGAGKTTIFKILFGLLKPDSGNFKIDSSKKKSIGGIIEKPALYEYLNAYQNLYLFAKIQNALTDPEYLNNLLQKIGLPLDRKDPVRNFSLGMKQRLGIAISLLNNPECLVLDEPFSGLDPLGISALKKLIVELARKDKLAIIISSHNIHEISKICDTLYIIKNGALINKGETQDIINQNTDTFSVCGLNLSSSKILKKYNLNENNNCITIKIGDENISDILQKLHEEGVKITSCIPEINMDKLFKIEPR